MIIVSFYTKLYEEQHHVLKDSLEKLNLRYDIQKVASRGSWKANCLYRAQFLIYMMKKYNDSVLWLDADAEVLKYPSLLYTMDESTDLAWYDREGKEIMLGTSYWKNSPLVKHLLMDWVAHCDLGTQYISQKDFMRLYNQKYKGKFIVQILPESYCHIFDKPSLEEPCIIHNQLSRKMRKITDTEGKEEETPKEVTVEQEVIVIHPSAPVEEVKVTTTSPGPAPTTVAHSGVKKKVFLPLNQTNWAFDFRCTALEKHLAPFYDIKKVNGFEVARKGLGFHADLVYWPTYESLDTMGANCHKTCATIGGLVVRSLDESIEHFGKALAIAVPNKTWYLKYLEKNLPNIKFYLIPNGVNIDIFIPKPKNNNEFIVGWVGNDRPDRARIKRIEELRRACKKLHITLLEQGKSAQIMHHEMPAFYQNLDLYVNLSITEGSNNCILEAAACGVPVLGTEVGNIPELKEVGAFTVRHDLSNLEEQLSLIKDLRNRREIGEMMREEMVANYSSNLMALRYKEMFDYCLSL